MAVALFLLEADSSQSLARQRVFRDRLNPLDAYNNAEFISRYRITKNIFVQLERKCQLSSVDQQFDQVLSTSVEISSAEKVLRTSFDRHIIDY